MAAAVLMVGTGAALLFRLEDADNADTLRSTTPPLPATADTLRPPTSEPKLAGRIEPFAGSAYRPATESDEPAGTDSAKLVETRAERASPDVQAADAIGSIGKSAVTFAAKAVEVASAVESPLTGQTVRRPSAAEPLAAFERSRAAFDRWDDNASRDRAPERLHRIVDGDTLAGIARRYLGDAERVRDLFEYNRDVLATPDLLPIGKELRIPPRGFVAANGARVESPASGLTAVATVVARPPQASGVPASAPIAASTTVAGPPVQTYFVQPHDTLALIARKLYGDIGRQAELIAANRGQLRTAKDLRPGMTLLVPGGHKPE